MARQTLEELGRLAQADAALAGSGEDLLRTLGELELFVGDDPGPGRVQVARPQDLRARRVRALFICGLNEGVFPRPARPDPFLGDDDRHEINVATGLRLRHHDDTLATERLFFYAAASRPTDLLALSWHTGDDDGKPAVRSFFVDDVAELFAPELLEQRRRRGLGAAGWEAADAPTAREARRAAAAARGDVTHEAEPIGPLLDPEVLQSLNERESWSASALETWRACPVRWFVERQLNPQGLEPDPEPLRARDVRARGAGTRVRRPARRTARSGRASGGSRAACTRRSPSWRASTASPSIPTACAPKCAVSRPT